MGSIDENAIKNKLMALMLDQKNSIDKLKTKPEYPHS
jgi:hypothetical protein